MNSDDLLELGLSFHRKGEIEKANQYYTEILSHDGNHADANHLSGLANLEQGDTVTAIEKIKKAITVSPSEAIFHNSLGNAYKAQKENKQAEQAYLSVLKIEPDFHEAHLNLGKLYELNNDLASAESHFLDAIKLNSTSYEYVFSLARLFVKSQQFIPAIEYFQEALKIRPNDTGAHNGLGFSLEKLGRLNDAIKYYEKAREANPADATILNNLGNALHAIGRAEDALKYFKKCIEIQPENELAWDRYLFALIFSNASDRKTIFQENKRWGKSLESRIPSLGTFIAPPRDPGKKIKIGYYSKEFYSHVSALFFETILKHHDRDLFEIHCYSDCVESDAVTLQLEKKSDFWCDISKMDLDKKIQTIRSESLDIFVGTTNFLPSNRIISAYKPAPIVVSYMNQVSTTGLESVDYLITDKRISPENLNDQYFTEKLIRLTDFICYSPPHNEVPILPPPAIENGYITFGSFNNLAKMNKSVISTWSSILDAVENSRIRLVGKKFHDETIKTYFLSLFAKNGISADRIEFGGLVDGREDYLSQYNLIDIALDTFPFCGGTVTDETCYMGVPLITLIGDREMGSMSYSKLTRLGLAELASESIEGYITSAIGLASDLNKIIQLKTTIRQRAFDTILNGKAHVAELERSYRQMWEEYCSQ